MSEQNLPDVIDAEACEVASAPVTLFGTNDAAVALARMTEHAKVLVDVVRDRKLSKRIGGRDHLLVEAWTTLGGMIGIVPVVVETRPNETGDGYVARVEARRVSDGMVVGAAEAECSRAEPTWAKRHPYALRSMSQTRATSRALRAPLGQIVVLAGYEAASAEEIPVEPDPVEASPRPSAERRRPTKQQMTQISHLLDQLAETAPTRDWKSFAVRRSSGSSRTHVVRDRSTPDPRTRGSPAGADRGRMTDAFVDAKAIAELLGVPVSWVRANTRGPGRSRTPTRPLRALPRRRGPRLGRRVSAGGRVDDASPLRSAPQMAPATL